MKRVYIDISLYYNLIMNHVKHRYEAIYNNIGGWCTVEKANKLIDLVDQTNPNLVVELGVFYGKSLIALAMASKQKNPFSVCIGIDPWKAEHCLEGNNDKANNDWWAKINYDEVYTSASKLMERENVSSIVRLWKQKSSEAASIFKENSIDILHQDSNHSEEITCEEVELFWNKVRPEGIWIFDDTNWPTTKKAQGLLVSKGYTEIHNHELNGQAWKVYKRNLLSV